MLHHGVGTDGFTLDVFGYCRIITNAEILKAGYDKIKPTVYLHDVTTPQELG